MNFRESSIIATVLTKKAGKVKLMVKGCRRPKSRFCGAMEAFNQTEVIYYKRETKELYTLSDVSIINNYEKIRCDNNKVSAALVLCEFFYKTLPLEESDPAACEHMALYLEKLTKARANMIKPLVFCYLLNALAHAGFKPHLDNCVRCHRPVDYANKKLDFSISGGGLVCRDDLDDSVVFLSNTAVRLLKDIYENKKICMDQAHFQEIEKLIPGYLRYHMDQLTLNSLKFLE
jgi:DNA repair protein RecO (recombination protein O)